MGSESRKQTLLFLAHPLTGHITPTLRIASHLSSLGHNVYFLGPTSHEPRIKSAGCIFLPLLDSADIDDLTYYAPDKTSSSDSDADWQSRALVDFERIWISTIPDEFKSLTAAISHITTKYSADHYPPLDLAGHLTIISEAMFFGILPLFLNNEHHSKLKIKSVCLSIMVPFIRSPEVGPGFCDSLPFLSDRALQLERAKQQWEVWEEKTAHLSRLLDAKLVEAGASTTGIIADHGPFLSGVNYTLGHVKILQLGVPSFFYPRQQEESRGRERGEDGGWPANFKFIGVLPPATEPAKTGWNNLPVWWDEIKSAATATTKKIVVVAQGTVEVDPHDLIIPTISAMSSPLQKDVLVVAILGRKGATLPKSFKLPDNARVTDYLHYDAVLPYADAWVHNGGYGAVQHGIAHGVPMVVTGEGQDKADNAKRVAWSGIGVNLGAVRPEVERVKEALEAVLYDQGYRKRVKELQEESNKLDCLRLAEEEILAVAEQEEA
ncbi:4'-demethylrebeccamycin synthase [Cladorrhinum sp. PSN259]|nr:4'-demethylrebeccamycin synthase [Cladorrhinum sp. PSN259]